jgi:hypothetical protein
MCTIVHVAVSFGAVLQLLVDELGENLVDTVTDKLGELVAVRLDELGDPILDVDLDRRGHARIFAPPAMLPQCAGRTRAVLTPYNT